MKAAVVQLIVDKNRPTPCPVPMCGAAGTAGTPASGSWLSGSQRVSRSCAAMSSADSVWLKGDLPIIIGLPYGSADGEPSLWELAVALRYGF